MMKGAKMGKIINTVANSAKKVKEAAKKNGPDVLKAVGLFAASYLAGYGIGSLVIDLSGARKQSYIQIYNQGKQIGWSNGYEDGMTAAAVLDGVRSGNVEPKYLGAGIEG